jgi:hypothetical protein
MATVVRQPELTSRIDYSLEYLFREWTAIPEVASTWESWDELDRLDFVLEWQLREDRLHLLQRWNEEGRLSAQQQRRFDVLDQLIQLHRPTLERLLAE